MTARKPNTIDWLLFGLGCNRELRNRGWYARRIRGRRVLCQMPGKRKATPIGLQAHELTRIGAEPEPTQGEGAA